MKASFRVLPEQKELLACFEYIPETGKLFKKAKNKRICTGFKRYRTDRNGEPWMYVVSFNGIQYAAHRIIWKMVTGEDPAPLTIDHIDRDPFNNKWVNLRIADAFLQSSNREWRATKGHKGIAFHKATQKWQVRVNKDGKRIYVGIYKTKEEAVIALKEYEKTYKK
jgi:hypothetical protein